MQDAVMFYKEKNLDTIRRGITEHYQYSKDLWEMWFYLIEKDASRLERIGISGDARDDISELFLSASQP